MAIGRISGCPLTVRCGERKLCAVKGGGACRRSPLPGRLRTAPSHWRNRPPRLQRRAQAPENTIPIVTTLASTVTNSAGLGGPGDVVAQVFTFELSPGVTGHIDASVQLVSSAEQLSHVAFVFPHGQIEAQAAITLPPTSFTAAIIGGTGAYEGVGGEVVNTVTSRTPLTIDRTLHLIYPRERD